MHGMYNIDNELFRYVLYSFVMEPVFWNRKRGYRPLYEKEKLAMLYFWNKVGSMMNIDSLIEDINEVENFYTNFEKENMYFDDANRILYDRVVPVIRKELPFILALGLPVALPLLLDNPVEEAFGLPKKPTWQKNILNTGLKLRGKAACICVLNQLIDSRENLKATLMDTR